MSMGWRQRAVTYYLERLPRLRLESAPWVTDETLLKVIRREDYPFGYRSGWAYQSWLAAYRDVLCKVKTGAWPKRKRRLRVVLEQLTMDLEVKREHAHAAGEAGGE